MNVHDNLLCFWMYSQVLQIFEGMLKFSKAFQGYFQNLLRIELLSTVPYYGFITCAIENLTNNAVSVEAPTVL